MPRGENPEFQKRVGVLSQRLRYLNVYRMIDSRYSDVVLDQIDVESYITERELPREIFEQIKPKLEMLQDRKFDFTGAELSNELEKYAYQRKKFRARHEK